MSWPGGNQQGGQWGPPGGYGGPPPQYGGGPYPPRRPGGGLSPIMVAVLAIVLVAVLIIAVAVVVVALRGDPGPSAGGTSPSATETAPEQEPDPTDESASPPAKEELLHDGWQRVLAAKHQLVYEVPSDDGWKVDSTGTVRGWEGDKAGEMTTMSGTAGYRDREKCENRSLAELGTRSINDSDDTKEMSEGLAIDWALVAYDTDKGEPEVNTRSVSAFDSNGLKGHHAIVDVKVKVAEKGCDPKTARVHAVGVTFPKGGGTRALIIDAHTGVEGAVEAKTIDAIVATLRDKEHKV